MDVPGAEEGGMDFLGFDFLAAFEHKAEGVLVVEDGFFEGFDGNAQVVDFRDYRGGMMTDLGGMAARGLGKAARVLMEEGPGGQEGKKSINKLC